MSKTDYVMSQYYVILLSRRTHACCLFFPSLPYGAKPYGGQARLSTKRYYRRKSLWNPKETGNVLTIIFPVSSTTTAVFLLQLRPPYLHIPRRRGLCSQRSRAACKRHESLATLKSQATAYNILCPLPEQPAMILYCTRATHQVREYSGELDPQYRQTKTGRILPSLQPLIPP